MSSRWETRRAPLAQRAPRDALRLPKWPHAWVTPPPPPSLEPQANPPSAAHGRRPPQANFVAHGTARPLAILPTAPAHVEPQAAQTPLESEQPQASRTVVTSPPSPGGCPSPAAASSARNVPQASRSAPTSLPSSSAPQAIPAPPGDPPPYAHAAAEGLTSSSWITKGKNLCGSVAFLLKPTFYSIAILVAAARLRCGPLQSFCCSVPPAASLLRCHRTMHHG